MEQRHALGGARTLGKLDESSTGARLSAQMLGGQVKMHIGVIGMQSLAYDALFSLCTQKFIWAQGGHECTFKSETEESRHALPICLPCLSVWRRYGPRTWKLLWKKDIAHPILEGSSFYKAPECLVSVG